jgi:hypothetical protein
VVLLLEGCNNTALLLDLADEDPLSGRILGTISLINGLLRNKVVNCVIESRCLFLKPIPLSVTMCANGLQDVLDAYL